MASTRKSGILPFQQLRTLVRQRVVRANAPIAPEQVQPASLDLRLGTKAYRLLSSFLPEPSDQQAQFTIDDLYRSDLVMYDMDLSEGAILEKGHVYLVPLMEELKLPKDIRGRTNPKSSTGRLDIFTRVVTDLHPPVARPLRRDSLAAPGPPGIPADGERDTELILTPDPDVVDRGALGARHPHPAVDLAHVRAEGLSRSFGHAVHDPSGDLGFDGRRLRHGCARGERRGQKSRERGLDCSSLLHRSPLVPMMT